MSATGARRNEDGFALFYALLVVLVVGGIIAVTMATAQSELRQSAFELDFEDTVHVAEAGLEVMLQDLAEDADTTSPVPGRAPGDDAHDWAMAAATEEDASGFTLPAIDVGEGEAVAIRPSATDTEFVYAVGFTPSRDAFVNGDGESHARVLRLKIGFTSTEVEGNHAVTVGGNMSISSSGYQITGSQGSMHVNGAADIKVNNTSKGISYSGSCSDLCDDDSGVTGPVEPKPIPDLTIEDPWGTGDATAIVAEDDWFDYCDGQWYQREDGDVAPCTGAPVATPDGWSSNLKFDGSSVGDPDAVYWIDDPSTVEISKVTGRMTVIARGDIHMGSSSNSGPMEARYPGLLLFSEGDMDLGGNAEASDGDGALVYVKGSLTLRGTMNSVGVSYMARDAEVLGSEYKGSGNGIVRYDGGAIADLGGNPTPLVLRWDEIR